MLILFVRHGRTDWNAARRIQGRTDIPLSDQGIAEQTDRAIPCAFADAHVLSSPLQRAVQTARLMGVVAPEIVSELIEMDFGEWEGRTHKELVSEDAGGMRTIEAQGMDMRPPGGETPRDVLVRVTATLDRREEDRLVVFAHKGVIRAVFAAALDWDMTRDMPFKVDWTAGQSFHLTQKQWRLAQCNVALDVT